MVMEAGVALSLAVQVLATRLYTRIIILAPTDGSAASGELQRVTIFESEGAWLLTTVVLAEFAVSTAVASFPAVEKAADGVDPRYVPILVLVEVSINTAMKFVADIALAAILRFVSVGEPPPVLHVTAGHTPPA